MDDTTFDANASDNLFMPLVYMTGMSLGLFLPDTDLILLPILHHRSILTHSILIPYILWVYFQSKISLSFLAGLYMGMAIHFSADLLSATTGFGMIWLPWPIKIPLGPLSPVWLGVNALIAIKASLNIFVAKTRYYAVIAIVIAAAYAMFNEFAFLPFIAFGVLFMPVFYYMQKRQTKRNQEAQDKPKEPLRKKERWWLLRKLIRWTWESLVILWWVLRGRWISEGWQAQDANDELKKRPRVKMGIISKIMYILFLPFVFMGQVVKWKKSRNLR